MRNVVLPAATAVPSAKKIEQLVIEKKAEKKRILSFRERFNENRKRKLICISYDNIDIAI